MIVAGGVVSDRFETDQGGGVDAAGNVIAAVAGSGLKVKAGANTKLVQNAGPLVAGTLVVNNSKVTAQSVILIMGRGDGAGPGGLYETRAARAAGVSFTIVSTNVADTQRFDYMIVEPA